MTDMTPRPLTDALIDMAMDVANGVSGFQYTGETPDSIRNRARRNLYAALDQSGSDANPVASPLSYEMWRRGQQITSLVKTLRGYDEVLDDVRSIGVEPIVMLRELVRSYKAKGGELAAMQRKLDDVTSSREIAQTVGLRHAAAHIALKDLVKKMVDEIERPPGPGFFGVDWNTVLYYVGKLKELVK